MLIKIFEDIKKKKKKRTMLSIEKMSEKKIHFNVIHTENKLQKEIRIIFIKEFIQINFRLLCILLFSPGNVYVISFII